MILSEQQLKVQEQILLSMHKWCNIEEAKRKDLVFWCLYSETRNNTNNIYTCVVYRDGFIPQPNKNLEWYVCNIIWLPPTLSRVIIALTDICCKKEGKRISYDTNELFFVDTRDECKTKICDRKIGDYNLREQSEDTQNKIAHFLWING